jgi:hypothetical protein
MAQTKGKEAFCHCVDLQPITFRETAAPVCVCALCAIGSNRNAQAASTQSAKSQSVLGVCASGQGGGESFGGAPIIIFGIILTPFTRTESRVHDLICRSENRPPGHASLALFFPRHTVQPQRRKVQGCLPPDSTNFGHSAQQRSRSPAVRLKLSGIRQKCLANLWHANLLSAGRHTVKNRRRRFSVG